MKIALAVLGLVVSCAAGALPDLPTMRELMKNGGAGASGLAPAETARAARDLSERWGAIIRQLGISLD